MRFVKNRYRLSRAIERGILSSGNEFSYRAVLLRVINVTTVACVMGKLDATLANIQRNVNDFPVF